MKKEIEKEVNEKEPVQATEFIIPADLLQHIIDYLVERKYIKVSGLIHDIQTSVKPVDNGK